MTTPEESDRIKENDALRKKVMLLEQKNKQLQEEIGVKKRHLQNVQDYIRYEIIHYYTQCYRLRETASQFGFETVGECYDALTEYCGCPGPAQAAEDYMECYKDIFGWEYEEETDRTSDSTNEFASNRDSCSSTESE